MIILLNKIDLVDPGDVETTVAQATVQLKDVLQTRLSHFLGPRVSSFPILPCSIVDNPRHGSIVDTERLLREVIRKVVDSTIVG